MFTDDLAVTVTAAGEAEQSGGGPVLVGQPGVVVGPGGSAYLSDSSYAWEFSLDTNFSLPWSGGAGAAEVKGVYTVTGPPEASGASLDLWGGNVQVSAYVEDAYPPAPTPEPGTLAPAALGVVMALACRRCRRRRAAA